MLLDSGVIIEVFRSTQDSKHFRAILRAIGDEETFVSVIQLAEVADWAQRNQLPVKERVASIKDFARIVPLEEQICIDASEIKRRRREMGYSDFSIIDGIILASARLIGHRLLTFDGDFAGESDCVLLH